LDKHQRATKNGAWEDVSEEVCKEIAEIWGNRYGVDWHRELVKKFVACRGEEQKTAEAARKKMVERLKESTRGSLSGAFTK
jgi:VIT1/CCC1 family predicted Fe2+/Mn2+ transporter